MSVKSKPSDPVLPGFASYYNYTKDIPTRFVIVSKQSNQVVGEFTTSDGIFVTHQLNSYEKDGLMYLDMLTYHANIYALLTIKNIVEKPTTPIDTHVERFVIDMSDWSLVKRIDLYPSAEFKTVEFSTINYEHYSSKPYKYAYMTGLNPAVTTLIKLNVETNKAVYWGPHDGLLPSEPIFIPSPNAVDEDDGVIVTNVLDTNTSKGIVVVLDAKSFTELGRAVSSELMPFGLHSRFIARKFERRSRHSLLRFLSDSSVHKVTRV
uniref:Beta,beta-carotene 15,15'-monooxygenase-like n=1 Tax=Saccoglossus kowalevskii TaxID=10224 RepID=A0ABM0MIC6_SACKO|nr:PREDICTED: beta,beta-carotene 15,15'-monooxygenase-like [Saccoglossus kowalevskii]